MRRHTTLYIELRSDKRIMRRIKETNEKTPFRCFSGFLPSWCIVPTIACWTECPASYQLCRYACVHRYSPNRPSGMNEMQCDRHTQQHQHRLNTHTQRIMCCIIWTRARACWLACPRSPLCAGVVYFIFIPFSSLFGKNKIQKKKREDEKRYASLIFFFFPFNVRRARMCAFTFAYKSFGVFGHRRRSRTKESQVAQTKNETRSFSCCSSILGFGSNKIRSQVIKLFSSI